MCFFVTQRPAYEFRISDLIQTCALPISGITGSAGIADWGAIVRQNNDLVSSLRQAKYADLLPAYNGLAYLEGKARLLEGGVVVDGHLLKAPKVIITTGARPAVPSDRKSTRLNSSH